MNDVNRIPKLINLLERFWFHYPALSFNTLVYQLHWEYSHDLDRLGQVVEYSEEGVKKIGFDMASVADDDFIKFLKSKCDSLQNI